METNTWLSIRDQSLAIYARNAGFDLSIYEEYSETTQVELRKRAIDEALGGIATEIDEEHDVDVYDIERGVYVILLANPLAIRYRYGRSQVIYIGRGSIMGRIKSHFERSLFDFMNSLSGANFDFWFAKPRLAGTEDYYKHIEHLMLSYFHEKFGGINDARRFPILNKNAGAEKNIQAGDQWWKKPLKTAGKRPLWELVPTNHSDFETLD